MINRSRGSGNASRPYTSPRNACSSVLTKKCSRGVAIHHGSSADNRRYSLRRSCSCCKNLANEAPATHNRSTNNDARATYHSGTNNEGPNYHRGTYNRTNNEGPKYHRGTYNRTNNEGPKYHRGINNEGPKYHRGINNEGPNYHRGINNEGPKYHCGTYTHNASKWNRKSHDSADKYNHREGDNTHCTSNYRANNSSFRSHQTDRVDSCAHGSDHPRFNIGHRVPPKQNAKKGKLRENVTHLKQPNRGSDVTNMLVHTETCVSF